MLYLSPVWSTLTLSNRAKFGYMQTARNDQGSSVGSGIKEGYPWMLDNGAFLGSWKEEVWVGILRRWQPYTATCIAAVCPDVVGDAAATLTRFWQYAPVIRDHGYKVAFVTQDGLTLDAVPWGEFDVLFVGGTDKHKLTESWPFILAAKERGKWVHVGRVNSAKRIDLFYMADSCDGTSLAIEPSTRNQNRFLHAVNSANAKKGTIPLWTI